MISKNIAQLLSIASEQLNPNGVWRPPSLEKARVSEALLSEWMEMLSRLNGFYCFESALHVFPDTSFRSSLGVEDWNRDALWRNEYDGLDPNGVFVSEDAFGNQFFLLDASVNRFDAETGEVEVFSSNVDGWAAKILQDFNLHTGYPLARDWQAQNGPLAAGHRLIPKVPFVLGGDYKVENLYSCEAVSGMQLRGSIAVQIAEVPDGDSVRLLTSTQKTKVPR